MDIFTLQPEQYLVVNQLQSEREQYHLKDVEQQENTISLPDSLEQKNQTYASTTRALNQDFFQEIIEDQEQATTDTSQKLRKRGRPRKYPLVRPSLQVQHIIVKNKRTFVDSFYPRRAQCEICRKNCGNPGAKASHMKIHKRQQVHTCKYTTNFAQREEQKEIREDEAKEEEKEKEPDQRQNTRSKIKMWNYCPQCAWCFKDVSYRYCAMCSNQRKPLE